MIVGHEGTPEQVAARRAAVSAVLTDLGGTPGGEGPGRAWSAGRYAAPYLRDSLLDAGVLVETLETATWWSRLRELYDAVSAALRASLGDSTLVLCHLSHVYETGASLYFTVAAAEGDDPIGRWREAKQAASAAIVSTRRHDHPPPRRRDRPPAVARGRDRRRGRRGAAGGQGRRRPRGHPQPRDPRALRPVSSGRTSTRAAGSGRRQSPRVPARRGTRRRRRPPAARPGCCGSARR